MSTWFAVLLLVVAVAATYLFCLRPMRRGECGMAAGQPNPSSDKERELAELRRKVEKLRAESAKNDSAS